MNEAKSDLINVLSSLEAHWHVLEAEVVEINRDIEYCEQCLRSTASGSIVRFSTCAS